MASSSLKAAPTQSASTFCFPSLKKMGSDTEIEHEIFEVSQNNIGIVTMEFFSLGTRVTAKCGNNEFHDLLVHEIAGSKGLDEKRYRFRLNAYKKSINFEKLLIKNHHITQNNSSSHQPLQMRFIPKNPSTVAAKTFGSQLVYQLSTINASKSGLLLRSVQGMSTPFQDGTLLELVVRANDGDCIPCLAKVMRSGCDKDWKAKFYGVSICELQPEYKQRYDAFIDQLEINNNFTLNQNIA